MLKGETRFSGDLATDVPVVSGDSGDEVSGNGGNVTVACSSCQSGGWRAEGVRFVRGKMLQASSHRKLLRPLGHKIYVQ